MGRRGEEKRKDSKEETKGGTQKMEKGRKRERGEETREGSNKEKRGTTEKRMSSRKMRT